MTKSTNTKRALLLSVLSLFCCVAVFIGSTFAWFTDSATANVSSIMSGKLDVQLIDDNGDEIDENATLNWIKKEGTDAVLWEPGCTYELPAVRVKNNGNLALKYKLVVNGLAGSAKLLEAIDFNYTDKDGNPVELSAEGFLAPQAVSDEIVICGTMKQSAGNEYMNLSLTGISISVVATQASHEFDSNSNDYDANAQYSDPIVADGGEMTIDLDKTPIYADGDWGAIQSTGGATVTVNGKGTVTAVESKDRYAMAVYAYNGKVIINDGYFTQDISGTDSQYDLIYADGTGVIEINGGTFKSVTPKWTLNIKDNSQAKIIVKGGSFYKYDPSNSLSENPAANFVADGYTVVKNGDWYTVVKATASNTEEFKNAVAGANDGDTILLTDNIELSSTLSINKNITIDGNGNTISENPVYVGANNEVTFKNVNFAEPVNSNDNASSVYASGLTGKVVFDGCKFSDTQWDSIQITPKAGAEVVITNCEFSNNVTGHRFIHIEADYCSNADVKITIRNNKFGSSANMENSIIDIDYINIDGIDAGGNTFADENGDIYICGATVNRTISCEEAYVMFKK
jgi:predicted ribosomally synthesized peptide with SipW-like signal peptide